MSVNKSAVELRLLVAASAYRLNSDDTSKLQELAEEDIDWVFFFSLARRHKVFPRVWNNINATIPGVLPDGTKAEQKSLIRSHILHCMATVGQLCGINLIYLCLHGTKHCWEQLDLIACLAELLLKERQIDWDLVFQVSPITQNDGRFFQQIGGIMVDRADERGFAPDPKVF